MSLRPRSKRSFTIIELIIAMSLLVLVANITMVVLSSTRRATRHHLTSATELNQMRKLLNTFRRDVRTAARVLRKSGDHVSGADKVVLDHGRERSVVYCAANGKIIRLVITPGRTVEYPFSVLPAQLTMSYDPSSPGEARFVAMALSGNLKRDPVIVCGVSVRNSREP